MRSNPQRELAWRELHARPYVRFSAPAHVLHLMFLAGEETVEADRERRLALTRHLELGTTYETPRHSIHAATLKGLGRLVVSWERHADYVVYNLFLYELGPPFQPFGFDFSALLPGPWLADLGAPLVATLLAVGAKAAMPATPEGFSALFEGHTLNGSQVMAGRAEAWSCYRVHDDGFGRIAIVVSEMSPPETGRTVDRMLAIEDFWHLTLLSLPLAGQVRRDLAAAERRLEGQMDELRRADALADKRAVLNALLALAAEVEHLRAQVAHRFAGSSAYFALLESRFAELREGKIERVLPLSRFVMRRVRPAGGTYRNILERLVNFSDRVSRAADLLRTGIELDVEEQNQRLLAGADRRARLQLRLQGAVESLSVVVITYYALGLIGYALGALTSLGVAVDAHAIQGLGLPVVLAAVWTGLHLVRRRFRDVS